MKYILATEVNESGNEVFKKKRRGKDFTYLAKSESGEVGQVSKGWILQNIDNIVNCNVDKNASIYVIDVKGDKKVSSAESKVDLKGNVCTVHSTGALLINHSDLIYSDSVKVVGKDHSILDMTFFDTKAEGSTSQEVTLMSKNKVKTIGKEGFENKKQECFELTDKGTLYLVKEPLYPDSSKVTVTRLVISAEVLDFKKLRIEKNVIRKEESKEPRGKDMWYVLVPFKDNANFFLYFALNDVYDREYECVASQYSELLKSYKSEWTSLEPITESIAKMTIMNKLNQSITKFLCNYGEKYEGIQVENLKAAVQDRFSEEGFNPISIDSYLGLDVEKKKALESIKRAYQELGQI